MAGTELYNNEKTQCFQDLGSSEPAWPGKAEGEMVELPQGLREGGGPEWWHRYQKHRRRLHRHFRGHWLGLCDPPLRVLLLPQSIQGPASAKSARHESRAKYSTDESQLAPSAHATSAAFRPFQVQVLMNGGKKPLVQKRSKERFATPPPLRNKVVRKCQEFALLYIYSSRLQFFVANFFTAQLCDCDLYFKC